MITRIMFFMTMLLLFPGIASAENLFDPVTGDQSLIILDSLFGKLGIFGPGISDGFAASMSIFNGAVLIIGGVLVAYSLIIGTIGTAHDGEMMGRKYSSVFIPLRTVAGTALVLPVIGGGSYCLMQLIVGWLIVQGVGLADSLWLEYMKENSIAQTATVGVRTKEAKNVVWKAFGNAVCMKGLEKIYKEDQSQGALYALADPQFQLTTNTNSFTKTKTWNFGVTNSTGMFTKDTCGSLTYNYNVFKDYSSMKDLTRAKAERTAALSTAFAEKIGEAVDKANLEALSLSDKMANEAVNLAEEYVNNPSMGFTAVGQRVDKMMVDYNNGLKAQAGILLNEAFNFSELSQNSTKEGWILAGAWFLKMANIMDVAGTVMNMHPTVTTGNGVPNVELKEKFIKEYGSTLKEIEIASGNTLGISEGMKTSDEENASLDKLTGTEKNTLEVESRIVSVLRWGGNFMIQENEHPIMVMKAMGSWILGVATILLTAFGGIMVTGGALPFVGDGWIAFVQVIALVFIPPLVAVGFTLSFVMPMMPFMIWLGCIVGWLILCVEAIVAAPMWAIMHLSMSGDEMVGTGAQGYRLVLSLMLRPALMIFGFIAAISIVQVLGQFINRAFTDVFLLSQQDRGVISSLVSLIAFPTLYLGCMWVLIIKCFEIIHKIPDQLLQWFGGGGAQLGSEGQQVGGLQSAAFMATAAAGRMAGSAGEHIHRVKDMAEQKQQSRLLGEQKMQDQNREQDASINKMGGEGASDVVNSMAMSNMGDRQVDASKPKEMERFNQAKINAKNQVLGVNSAITNNPDDSSALRNFNKNVLSDMEDNKSFGQAVNEHFQKAFEEEHGEGSYEFALKASQMEGSAPTEALQSRDFGRNAGYLKHMNERMKESGISNPGVHMGKIIKDVDSSNISNDDKMNEVSKRVERQIFETSKGMGESSGGSNFGGESFNMPEMNGGSSASGNTPTSSSGESGQIKGNTPSNNLKDGPMNQPPSSPREKE